MKIIQNTYIYLFIYVLIYLFIYPFIHLYLYLHLYMLYDAHRVPLLDHSEDKQRYYRTTSTPNTKQISLGGKLPKTH